MDDDDNEQHCNKQRFSQIILIFRYINAHSKIQNEEKGEIDTKHAYLMFSNWKEN